MRVRALSLPRHGWWPCFIVDDEVEQMWLDLPIGAFAIIVAVTTIITIDAGSPSSEPVSVKQRQSVGKSKCRLP